MADRLIPTVRWEGDAATGHVVLLDQTKLPTDKQFVECRTAEAVWDAIKRLVVRGAPALSIGAAYGLVVCAQSFPKDATPDQLIAKLAEAVEYMKSSRPTAVNLQWAVERILRKAKETAGAASDLAQLQTFVLAEAREIHQEDTRLCQRIGENAVPLLRPFHRILTHCNAGATATAGIGTATAPMYLLHAEGHDLTVYCDETRPLLQGSRLTAWELQQAGINAVVITDSMAAQVMREGRVQAVITGADRIAANGDTANKIGTYGLAVLAKHHNIPFFVAAPYSTFDLTIPDGSHIEIEQRNGEEVAEGFGRRTAPQAIATYNPAFDVTPHQLITAIVTDRGVVQPVTNENIAHLIQ
eukprot:TRINITY_DN549_c0_g1_i1.p2 TRINITY_DN549_c0_g1~~TRINITY_DN549_c0_g1_i1.p2  ORF type:complete len:356 (-),score=92.13 TRINITY_DN549_c0_g1_i1:217-1284(-)